MHESNVLQCTHNEFLQYTYKLQCAYKLQCIKYRKHIRNACIPFKIYYDAFQQMKVIEIIVSLVNNLQIEKFYNMWFQTKSLIICFNWRIIL